MRGRCQVQDTEPGLNSPARASNRKLRTRAPIEAGRSDASVTLAAVLTSVENRRKESRREEADPGDLTRQVEWWPG